MPDDSLDDYGLLLPHLLTTFRARLAVARHALVSLDIISLTSDGSLGSLRWPSPAMIMISFISDTIPNLD